jgi:hypothetical protein
MVIRRARKRAPSCAYCEKWVSGGSWGASTYRLTGLRAARLKCGKDSSLSFLMFKIPEAGALR